MYANRLNRAGSGLGWVGMFPRRSRLLAVALSLGFVLAPGGCALQRNARIRKDLKVVVYAPVNIPAGAFRDTYRVYEGPPAMVVGAIFLPVVLAEKVVLHSWITVLHGGDVAVAMFSKDTTPIDAYDSEGVPYTPKPLVEKKMLLFLSGAALFSGGAALIAAGPPKSLLDLVVWATTLGAAGHSSWKGLGTLFGFPLASIGAIIMYEALNPGAWGDETEPGQSVARTTRQLPWKDIDSFLRNPVGATKALIIREALDGLCRTLGKPEAKQPAPGEDAGRVPESPDNK